MESRVAVISIIVGQNGDVENLNRLLSSYSQYVIGRMGIPYRQRNVNIISVVLDAPQDEIAALAGKIGALTDVTAKTAYSAVQG
ncbi:MAG: iron-only hydrogenase system regulator [Oscillospiraceae bacterium]|nr:iron-only hydrogenase system regulator [Oscillospiraceae bacterium]